ncbi:MAG: divergent PAP2 family protein [Chloroflexota bacterium]|nr:divergent PAP2 family protein [Chloroflexota bacterium]
MTAISLFENHSLWAALTAWFLAQVLKMPIYYLSAKQWDWGLLLSAGGMPSSHSALVSAAAYAIGLFQGFDRPVFALAVTLAVIVIYDATGIRRQAGKHAALINTIIRDLKEGHLLRKGHPLRQETQEQLKEVLGHTPLEAMAGTIFGIIIAQIFWIRWG